MSDIVNASDEVLAEALRRRGLDQLADLLEECGQESTEDAPPDYCSKCGGVRNEECPLFDGGACRCGGRERRLAGYLDAVDPELSMTFENMKNLDPSMERALGCALAIGAGTRLKGMLLLGKPGLGKTHLMVALGRELLKRGRDVGYYNVARLVSRIQDTYSEGGVESRRAIVEDVASHEVVLLDDLGKEHQSANVDSIVYELIDALYARSRIVVVSTNVPSRREDGYEGKTLGERYDEAVRSRIKAMCEAYVVKGEDRRAFEW